MPLRISDSRIRSFTETLQRSAAPKITDANVLDILAAVGDGSHASGDKVKTQLTRPGITRKEQFDLAAKGLTNNEKSDLGQLLTKSGFAMDPGAKNFLEALTGKAALIETFGPLTIVGDQKNGIAGIAKAGETIEAINLSAAPAGRLHLTDTMVIGTADASGKFLGTMPDVREGDMIRMRTRAADGSTSDWLTIQAKGVETKDTRNAIVNLERMDLAAGTDGITVTHNTGRPLTEPGATLQFTNVRTGEKTQVKATENGSIPAGLKLKGQAGDEFKVAGSDGTNNLDFATVTGSLKVPGGNTGGNRIDLPDPKMHKDEMNVDGTPKFKLERFTGPLFIDEPKADDVRQGAIGNCYFPAALASVAAARPDIIKNMIKDNGDGTYTVKFTPNSYGGASRPVEIKVDGDLYARSYGGPIYGSSLGGSTAPDKMELWYPLIEKAYAQWKGSYDTIGNGGVAGTVMSEVMGKGYKYENISAANKDRIYEMIKTAGANKQPMAAGTYGTEDAAKYTNTGVYANHAYSVLGVEEENGTKYVKIRNPWGQSEHGSDGKNDGFFRMELGKFAELYRAVHIINP
ncbi:MAG: C2 family cysteine protease [Archangium sp.]|nr:C2 family cysteine protease [Archangium sp.]